MPDFSSPPPAASPIAIRINGEQRTIPTALSLEALLDFLGLDKNRVAVEYNREIVKRAGWTSVTVAAGDSLEIVQFVGGG